MQVRPYFSEVSEFIEILKNQSFDFCEAPVSSSPDVSIVSSFYNVSREYFLEANRSILNQTFQNYEWIIVDDCSTDKDAIALFDELPKLNKRIKTLRHEKNRGLAAGRNTAIAQAKGKYLFFMDTDDILEPTMIEKCVLFLETHPDFSFVNSYSVGFGEQEYWWDKGFDKPSEFIKENRVTGRLLYRKDDFDAVGGFDEGLRFYEDWDRWLSAIARGQKGWTIPEYLDCYRRTPSGLLATSRDKAEEEANMTKLIRSRYSDFFETHEVPDTIVERPMFDLSAVRQKLEITNPVSAENEGKRILCWFPHFEVGGADKFNLDLLRGLRAKGYSITIVTTVMAEHSWFSKFYEITPDIFHLPRLMNCGHWLTLARYILESRHIDTCFLSNAYYAYYLLPSLRKAFPTVAFVDYTHTEDLGWRGGGYPRVSCQFSAFLDRHIVTSNHLAEHFIRLNAATASKLKVCYVNVDEQVWQADSGLRQRIRGQISVDNDTTVILFPARITAQKRPLFFIEIIKGLLDDELPVSVLMTGGGDLQAEVVGKVKAYRLESVVNILSFVSPEEMVSYYSAADVVLLPSAYEGISLVLYEAMSMGLPIVASAVGGQRELVVPGAGKLLALGKGDEAERDSYVEVLTHLVQKEEARQKLGFLARRRIESCFRLSAMVERMEAFFEEAHQHRMRVGSEHSLDTFGNMSEEMLLWIQEFSALDSFWSESQSLRQSLSESEAWAMQLAQERDLYKFKSEAWQRVAQRNQLALNRTSTAGSAVIGGSTNEK